MKYEFQETERIYAPTFKAESDDNDISEFILRNFLIPDDNIAEISSFISEDNELKKIIYDLPELIKNEFPQDKIQIRFYEEFQEDELILEIGIYTSFDEETSFKKEKYLENLLYDRYNWDSADKVLILMEY